MLDLETFPEEAWTALFHGQGVRPQRYHPFAEAMELGRLETTLSRMRQAMDQAVEAMPSHGDYIAAHCRAAEAR